MPLDYARYYICDRASTWAVYRDSHGVATVGEDIRTLDEAFDRALVDAKTRGQPFRIYHASPDGSLERLYDSSTGTRSLGEG